MGKTRKEYEAELEKNLEKIKKIIPDFTLTEEQKNIMLSEERIRVHEKYQSEPDCADPVRCGKRRDIASKYYHVGNQHAAVKRNWSHMVREENTKEDIEFNKRMFTNLSRDDELGEMARQNYLVESINQSFEIDNNMFNDDVSLEEFTDYCFKHQDIGGNIMETEHFVRDLEQSFVPKDKEKYKATCLYAANIGGIVRDQVRLVKKDKFLTLPVEFMTKEQMALISKHAVDFADDMSPGELSKAVDDISVIVSLESLKRDAKKDIQAFKNAFKPGEKYTAADFSNPLPINERVGGGYIGRKNTLLEGCSLIANFSSDVEAGKLNALKEAAAEFKQVLSSVGDVPTKEEQQKIIAASTKQSKAITGFLKSRAVSGSADPEIKKMAANLEKIRNTSMPFSREDNLEALVSYHQEDVKQFNLNNSVGQKVSELNNLYEEFRVDTIYGEKQTLSAGDIYDIRNKMVDILKTVDEKLTDDKTTSFEAKQYENIKDTVSKQLKGMKRAVPGMTLDKALSGKAREIDTTGRKFETVGNACSMRKVMTITGEDGSRIEGYFTEFTNIGVDAAVDRLQKHFDQAAPGKSEEVQQMLLQLQDKNLDFYQYGSFLEDHPKTTITEKEYNLAHSTLLAANLEREDYDITNTPDGGVVSQRNVAMSDVAQLIGAEDCIARSTVVTVYSDGKPYTGSFMETVNGEDLLHPTQDSKLFNAKPDCLDNSPALKQIADIQVLDWICGNGDRHAGNMLYEFDANGKISSIKGIDNDLSFACRSEVFTGKMTNIDDIKYMSSGMYNKLKDVTPEALKVTLSSSGLQAEEINFAVVRLEQVQNALKDNKIKVVNDEDFVKMKADDFLGVGTTAVSQIKTGIENLQKMSPEKKADLPKTKKIRDDEPLDMFEQVDSTQIGQNIEPMEELLNEMEDAEKGVYFGSTEYSNVKAALKQIVDASKLMTENGKLASTKNFDALDKACSVLQSKCKKYNDRKTKQGAIKDGKAASNAKTNRRIEAVEKVSKFCKNMSDSLKLALEPFTKTVDAKLKAEADRAKIDSLDPKTAGIQFKEWNKIALDKNATSREVLKAAEEIKTISKYMSEKRLSPKDCGLKKVDIDQAQSVVKLGHKLNLERVKSQEPKAVDVQAGAAAVM